jgi:hypothetical protein
MIVAPKLFSDDLQRVTDAFTGELERGQERRIALNYATAVYLQRHPFVAVGEARAMIRGALEKIVNRHARADSRRRCFPAPTDVVSYTKER